jgi:hypothetical protein
MTGVALAWKRVLLKCLDFDRFFAWWLAKSLNPTNEQLYKLEMGVFFFCWRTKDEAVGLPWREALEDQSASEYTHAQFFSDVPLPDYSYFEGRELEYSNWRGVQLNLGGSAIAKMFFGDISPKYFSWGDKLAFMLVLECFQSEFYLHLSENRGDSSLGSIAIAEGMHALNLQPFVKIDDAIAWRWRLLKVLMLLALRPSLANKL